MVQPTNANLAEQPADDSAAAQQASAQATLGPAASTMPELPSDFSERPKVRPGVRLAIDLGRVRVGIAKTDSEGILATPVTTAQRGKNDHRIIRQLIKELKPLEIYVGYPLNMDGSAGAFAEHVTKWATKLAAKIAPLPVRLIDERLTSVMAHRQLHAAGRKEITHRAVVDQVAAVNILESALAMERATGQVPGLAVAAQQTKSSQ